MSEYLADTPPEIPSMCPGCFDAVNPKDYDPRFCAAHQPDLGGALDRVVRVTGIVSGTGECVGEDNRQFCDLIHRRSA